MINRTNLPPGLARSPAALVAFQVKYAVSANPIETWPESFYEALYSKVTWAGVTFHSLRNPEHAKQVLVDHAHAFEKAPVYQAMLKPILGEGLITAEGEKWKVQRRLAAPAFRRAALELIVPDIATVAESTAGKLLDVTPSRLDILPRMADATFSVISKLLFGSLDGPIDHLDVESALKVYLSGLATPHAAPVQTAIRALNTVASLALEQQKHVGAESGGLLRLFIAGAEDNADITTSEICDNVIGFILAGHETAAVTLSWTLFLLAKHQDIQHEVVAEIDRVVGAGAMTFEKIQQLGLLRRAISESLRLYPPIANVARIAVQDVDLGDIQLAKGDVADVLIYPMHRNRLNWPNPDAFNPNRFLDHPDSAKHKFAFLPFGAGPRVCIGSQMAYLELTAMLAGLLRRCRFDPVPGYVPQPHFRITLRPHDGLPLIVAPRDNRERTVSSK